MRGLAFKRNLHRKLQLIFLLLMCAEIAGDIHLGDSNQPTCKNLLPFDLVS